MDRARGLAIGGLVVSLVLAGGAAYALDQATHDPGPGSSAAPEPVVTESPSAEPTTAQPTTPAVTATPAPTATPTPSATPTVAPTPSATPTARVTVSAAPRATTYPYPRPTTVYAGLALTARLQPLGGSRYAVEVMTDSGAPGATDGDGTIYLDSLTWGDGSELHGNDPTQCKTYPPPTSPPPPYRPEPDAKKATYSHTYTGTGVSYHVVLTVRSVNADCRPNGPRAETATLAFDVDT